MKHITDFVGLVDPDRHIGSRNTDGAIRTGALKDAGARPCLARSSARFVFRSANRFVGWATHGVAPTMLLFLTSCGTDSGQLNSRLGEDRGAQALAQFHTQFDQGTASDKNAPSDKIDSSKKEGALKSSAETVHSVELPHDESEFPPGPGKSIFVARCTVCHSLRYITMQPDFPEATWIKEVSKMRETWGAHITESEAKEIVAYLVLVKGRRTEE